MKRLFAWILGGVLGIFTVIGWMFSNKRLLLVPLALFVLGFILWQEILIKLYEPQPTTLPLETFAADYAGQRWLRTEGRLALEHHHIHWFEFGNVKSNRVHVFVPLVVKDWTESDPVSVVVSRTFAQLQDAQAWVKEQEASRQPYTAAGIYGHRDFAKYFSSLRPATPVVFIEDQQAPMTVLRMLTITGITLAGVAGLIAFHYLLKAVWGRMFGGGTARK